MGRNIGRKVMFFLILGIYVACPLYAKELFHASFDKGLDADNALGKKEAKIIGAAKITTGNKGYSSKPEGQGEALDVGYSTNETAVVAYSTRGNINSLQGTIEMWIKTNYDWNFKDSCFNGKDISTFFQAPFIAEGARIDLYCNNYGCGTPGYWPDLGMTDVGYNINDGIEEHFIYFRVYSTQAGWSFGISDWTKDNWHHIAITWTDTLTRLFVDKELRVEKKWDKPLNLMPFKDEFYIGGTLTSKSCRTLIDEVRISDEPLLFTKD